MPSYRCASGEQTGDYYESNNLYAHATADPGMMLLAPAAKLSDMLRIDFIVATKLVNPAPEKLPDCPFVLAQTPVVRLRVKVTRTL
jgi:hypothetical protein